MLGFITTFFLFKFLICIGFAFVAFFLALLFSSLTKRSDEKKLREAFDRRPKNGPLFWIKQCAKLFGILFLLYGITVLIAFFLGWSFDSVAFFVGLLTFLGVLKWKFEPKVVDAMPDIDGWERQQVEIPDGFDASGLSWVVGSGVFTLYQLIPLFL